MTGIAGRCARAGSVHAAAPPTRAMKSRRLIRPAARQGRRARNAWSSLHPTNIACHLEALNVTQSRDRNIAARLPLRNPLSAKRRRGGILRGRHSRAKRSADPRISCRIRLRRHQASVKDAALVPEMLGSGPSMTDRWRDPHRGCVAWPVDESLRLRDPRGHEVSTLRAPFSASPDPCSAGPGATGSMPPASAGPRRWRRSRASPTSSPACSPGAASRRPMPPRYLAPKLRDLLPDPATLVDMEAAAARLASAVARQEKVAIFGDYDVDGACSAALLAGFLERGRRPSAHPHPRPADRGLRPQQRGGPHARRGGRDAAGHGRLRHDQRRAFRRGASARARCRRARPPPGARAAAGGGGPGQSQPPGRPLRTRPSLRRGRRLPGAGRNSANPAPAGLLGAARQRAGSARGARSRRPGDGGGRRAAARAQPGLRPAGARHAARPHPAGPGGADGCRGPRRAGAALASRLPARAAHQCRRAHRRCKPRRAASAGGGRGRGAQHRRRAQPPESGAPGDRAAGGAGGDGRGRACPDGRARTAGAAGRFRRVASRHRRARRRPSEGALPPAGLRARAERGGRRDRLRPLGRGRRSRPGGSRRRRCGAGGQGWRPRHGGRRDAGGGAGRGLSRLPDASIWRRRSAQPARARRCWSTPR